MTDTGPAHRRGATDQEDIDVIFARTNALQPAAAAAGARPYAGTDHGCAWAHMSAAVGAASNAKRFAATTKRPARHLGSRTT